MKKLNFPNTIIVSLKAMVVSGITYAGFFGISHFFPERIGLMALYGIFSIWFWGFLANRFWSWE